MDIALYEPQRNQWTKILLLEAILKRHVPVEKAAEVFGVPRSTAYRLLKTFRQHDEDAFFDRRYGPREKTMEKLKKEQDGIGPRPPDSSEETEPCRR